MVYFFGQERNLINQQSLRIDILLDYEGYAANSYPPSAIRHQPLGPPQWNRGHREFKKILQNLQSQKYRYDAVI